MVSDLVRDSRWVERLRIRRVAGLDTSNPLVHNALNSRPSSGRERTEGVLEPDFDCRNAPAGDREVMMSENADFRIDVDAAKAVIYWKSLFADEVAARARRLAAESSQPHHV